MMKKILYLSILIFFSLSCSDKFLETVSTDTYNEGNWWLNEGQVISTLNGCYRTLVSDQFSLARHLREDNLTPNGFSFGGDSPTDVGEQNPGNDSRFQSKWETCYQGVGRTNYFLSRTENLDPNITNKLGRLRSEAKFLRAYYYFTLISYFGGVPLIVDEPKLNEQKSLPRDTKENVITQILKDLDDAASVLPVKYTDNIDIGRATKGAALALKARLFLYESRWDEAAAAAEDVMELGVYDLFPNYANLFRSENNNNIEEIFSVQFHFPDVVNNYNTILVQQQNIVPTLDLVNDYEMIDGLSIEKSPLYDPQNPYENRDPRLVQTVVLPGYMFRGIIQPGGFYYGTGFGFKKYSSYYDNVIQDDDKETDCNYIIIRYADVLLMYAESKNEADGPDQSIYDALHKVRARAGMPDIIDIESMDKDRLRDAIRHERRIELAMESLYLFDIRRWKTAEIVMNKPALNYKGEIVQNRRFNANRDYLWPIASNIIRDNPALTQNPNY